MNKKITIGITKPESRFENYRSWIKGDDENIELITLSADDNNAEAVKKCDGILLSGGVDVTPALYRSERTGYPNIGNPAHNPVRDEFERNVFSTAQQCNLPVLAICRGMQLVNVILGGTLVPDLEETGKEDHKRSGDTDKTHRVHTVEKTMLAGIAKTGPGIVNSAHHQAIKELSEQLAVNCMSVDGVIEGAEWKDPSGKPPLLCVQWHPERIADKKQNPLSENIRNWFLQQVKK